MRSRALVLRRIRYARSPLSMYINSRIAFLLSHYSLRRCWPFVLPYYTFAPRRFAPTCTFTHTQKLKRCMAVKLICNNCIPHHLKRASSVVDLSNWKVTGSHDAFQKALEYTQKDFIKRDYENWPTFEKVQFGVLSRPIWSFQFQEFLTIKNVLNNKRAIFWFIL